MAHLKRYLIERDIPGIGGMSVVELCGAARASNRAIEKLDGLIFISSPIFTAYAARVVELVHATRLPAIFEARVVAAQGGLMSYGPDLSDALHRAAFYTDRILKGTKPADLPIERPTRFELVINLKTAKALGLTIPPDVLAIADEVIE